MAVQESTHPVDRARALRPTILRAREAIEANRRIVPEVVEPMVEAQLFQLLVPADVGGPQVDPIDAYCSYEELAKADASVAWVAWNNSLPAVLSRGLDLETRREIFGDPRALYANSTRPSGRAVAVKDGVKLGGRWSLVSGCELASWIPVMAQVFENGEPRMLEGAHPDMRMFFLPKGNYEILDTWYTGGLRGSGSHDVVIEDVFVPDRRSCSPFAKANLEGPLFRFPFAPVLAAGCASICLGIAASSHDSVVELAADRPQVDPGPPMRERASVHVAIAEAETQIESARLFLHDSVAGMWEACAVGDPSLELRARLWRAVVNAGMVSKKVVGSMFETAGTTSLYTDSLLERCHRDIWSVTQHIVLNPMLREQAGRVRLGLPPSHALF